MTPYHSQYWAHLLTLKGAGGSIENLTRSISNARVDLNPHQVDAALFALRSPLSKGAILADEVGLGKTIEAGIVLAQRWAERKRRILLIVPATLRKQWQQELEEKFFLSSVVMDSVLFNRMQKSGQTNPFLQDDKIVICSYHFASAKAQSVQGVPWDLVGIDEAHRLRNVYKPHCKMARRIADASLARAQRSGRRRVASSSASLRRCGPACRWPPSSRKTPNSSRRRCGRSSWSTAPNAIPPGPAIRRVGCRSTPAPTSPRRRAWPWQAGPTTACS